MFKRTAQFRTGANLKSPVSSRTISRALIVNMIFEDFFLIYIYNTLFWIRWVFRFGVYYSFWNDSSFENRSFQPFEIIVPYGHIKIQYKIDRFIIGALNEHIVLYTYAEPSIKFTYKYYGHGFKLTIVCCVSWWQTSATVNWMC